MLTINIPNKYDAFIEEYSKKLTLNGFSNMSKEKLAEYSRTDLQCTGLQGEIAYALYSLGTADHLTKLIDTKYEHYLQTGKGDGGVDAQLLVDGKLTNIDVKTSHITDEKKIRSLNLIVSQNEFHPGQIYISAFAVSPVRSKANTVILAGWAWSDQVEKKRWKFDKEKFCVPVRDLNDMMKLEKYIRQ
jgi:hypothetical protein